MSLAFQTLVLALSGFVRVMNAAAVRVDILLTLAVNSCTYFHFIDGGLYAGPTLKY